MRFYFSLMLPVAALALLSGCANKAAPQQQAAAPVYQDVRDPLETLNRPLWDFNYDILDKYLLRPATVGYMTVVPKPARKGLVNAVNNLGEPASFVNASLQAKPSSAAVSAGRFLVNSTLGIFGLFDVASKIGLAEQQEDFNQTMAVWGLGHGAFLMLPALGPSTVRGTAGGVVDNLYFPLGLLNTPLSLTRAAIGALDAREQLMSLEQMLDESLDPYAFVKESYFQRELFKIHDGNPPQQQEPEVDEDLLEDLFDELE
ncbi:MAG: VacJ family lipoprotein [Gammaproteobacteria bacterium]|nr:VacJ family lipoprotein [Gammaproteobacteria bacterium]MBU1553202.1 VacJ family lipoprotein [Gammaproteobacteria bacterium]MBU2069631.1 VacJ family lipoprotein [Gammaproteobacteria bacterium]MBU2184496.1 VacJ family lipoprotein [Gammaproteobacteria bacterium]MBU2205178.1 VacJ family lipoprotein [Gammaproteobacteria bacterium]